MTLTFPTIAEQVKAEFQAATKTTSIATLAAKRGADKRKLWDGIEYTFDDDTKLITRGRGSNHTIETELP
jgi:hypothetical protein